MVLKYCLLLKHLFIPTIHNRAIPLVWVWFCFISFSLSEAWAQSAETRTAERREEIKPLQVGDTVPEELWQQEYSFLVGDSIKVGSLQNRKGKFVLLDFWATWCTACTKRFPEIDSLQYFTSDHLDVILINREKAENIQRHITQFFKQKSDRYPYGLDVPKMIMATEMNAMFPHKYIPYYVLIDDKGIILSMGNSRSFNAVRSIIAAVSARGERGGS